jgi:hypothetical protein
LGRSREDLAGPPATAGGVPGSLAGTACIGTNTRNPSAPYARIQKTRKSYENKQAVSCTAPPRRRPLRRPRASPRPRNSPGGAVVAMVTGVDPGHLRHSPACRRRTLETATSRRARCCLAHQFVHAPSGHGAIGPARRPAACAFQIGARRGGVAAPGREIAAFIEPLPACLALEQMRAMRAETAFGRPPSSPDVPCDSCAIRGCRISGKALCHLPNLSAGRAGIGRGGAACAGTTGKLATAERPSAR